MMRESGNGSLTEENNVSSSGGGGGNAIPSGSSKNHTALIHRHIGNHSQGPKNGGGVGYVQPSVEDVVDDVDVIVESPVSAGNFIASNNSGGSGSINSSEEEHLFIGGGSSSGGQNGAIRSGGESSRTSNNSHQSGNSGGKSTFRLVLGVVVLIIVDIIWVASSELSFHLFHEEKFDKPFFSTYVKTSMFLILLIVYIFWTPWYEQCQKADTYAYTLLAAEANANIANLASCNTTDESVDDGSDIVLSPPAFVPINYDTTGSGNESDDSAHQRSVRFSKLAEVRHLSEHEAAEAFYARLSYQASLQAEQLAYRLANRLSPSQTAHLAVTFCLMWFVANYTYQLAVSHTQVGIVNVLSSSSSLFTLLLAAVFPAIASDKFSVSKLLSVLVSIVGVGLVSVSDLNTETTFLPVGAIFALVSAFFFASYLVFLRKKVEHEDKLDIRLFFGFLGLFNLLLLWPLFFVLNYTEIEVFDWPTKRQWVFLVINGIIGTVFSEVLWIWGTFLTSSLIATLAISLTVPMTMVADVIFKRVSYSWLFYIGSVPMLFSFLAVTLLTHYENWDPVAVFCRRVFKRCWPRQRSLRYQRVLVNDMMDHNEQQERLLEDEESPEEERDEESGFGRENLHAANQTTMG